MPLIQDIRTLGDVAYQAVFTFPYSAYTISRSGAKLSTERSTGQQPDKMRVRNKEPTPATGPLMPRAGGGDPGGREGTSPSPSATFGDGLYTTCRSHESVSSVLAADPSMAPRDAWHKLYGHRLLRGDGPSSRQGQEEVADDGVPPSDPLERAEACGHWGSERPSELFLKIYHEALVSIDGHLERGMVSPSLMGSSGVMPLTIISTIPDIVRHMANAIVRAERDVFLATNFWQNSEASRYITDALKELSRRAGQRDPPRKVVVKVMYDRGSVRQLVEPHYLVPEKEYTASAVGLPRAHEIPNLDLQVMNYHNPLLGTFHCKFMVVDRRVAMLQSNNIQDNDNLEMLVHFEGAIVDSIYDMALLSWGKALTPPLPTHDSPAALHGIGCFRGDMAPKPATGESGPSNGNTGPHQYYDGTIKDEARRIQTSLTPSAGGRADEPSTHMEAVTKRLNHTTNPKFRPSPEQAAPEVESDEDHMTPYLAHDPHEPFPMALVCRAPHGPPNHASGSNPQNASWLAALKYASKSVFIQSPTLNAEPLLPAIIDACERGVDVTCHICLGYNDMGELLPMQGGHNEMVAHRLYAALSPAGRQRLHYYWYVAKDCRVPLVQNKRLRSCHIKLLIADGRVAVVGNGNQDTQSWFHSQEANVLLDLPPDLARSWADGLRRNQNTHLYGALSTDDGVWRDEQGKEAADAIGVDPGKFSWGKGIVAAVKRLHGTGGF